jgi:hypothetical protein
MAKRLALKNFAFGRGSGGSVLVTAKLTEEMESDVGQPLAIGEIVIYHPDLFD